MRVNKNLGPMVFVVEVFLLFSKLCREKTYCSVLLYRRTSRLCCFLENQVLNKGMLLRVKSSRPQDIISHFPVEQVESIPFLYHEINLIFKA